MVRTHGILRHRPGGVMGGAAGPDFHTRALRNREMTHTLEGRPVVGQTLGRRVRGPVGGVTGIAPGASVLAVAGHRGEAATR
jgi:hypothetical protein